MAAEFRTLSLSVPGNAGTKVVDDTASFSGPVQNAQTALKGVLFDYSSSDHHINVLEATCSVIGITGNTVRVRAVVQFADVNFDDSYTGRVEVLVIANVA